MLRRKSIQKRIAKTILFRKDGTLNFNLYRKCFSFNYRDGISDLDLQKFSQEQNIISKADTSRPICTTNRAVITRKNTTLDCSNRYNSTMLSHIKSCIFSLASIM